MFIKLRRYVQLIQHSRNLRILFYFIFPFFFFSNLKTWNALTNTPPQRTSAIISLCSFSDLRIVQSNSNVQFVRNALPDSPPLALNPNPIQPNPIMSSSFSPSRPPQQLIGVSRLRSSAVKKLPEPLRRAVADCLSSTLSPSNEPSRTLQVALSSSFSLRDSCLALDVANEFAH